MPTKNIGGLEFEAVRCARPRPHRHHPNTNLMNRAKSVRGAKIAITKYNRERT
jgi:hypothetical protein